jgi:UDP:flavonoid glycosyltransferase YjiC (YdhE family)
MAHFLLAWELGANLGHATRLRSVAQALKARGHRLSFVLRDVVRVQRFLGPAWGPVYQAPLLLDGSVAPAWTLADILLSCGYESADTLSGLAGAWKSLIELSGCDAVLADHSPTALLAARLCSVPALHLGHGFSIPPRESPLPVFRDWVPVADSHASDSDARALASVNGVLAAHSLPRLQQLCDMFYPEQTMLCAWPELDHYRDAGRSPTDYLGPDCEFVPGADPAWPDAPGPRVFAYLRASYPEYAEVLRALDAMRCSTVCYFPDRSASNVVLPESAHIHYSDQPVDLKQALSTCALVVCHAGQATVAQAMVSGVPCLMLPTQTEQFLLARQFEQSGAGVNAASLARPVDYATLIGKLTRPESAHAAAARALAQQYRDFNPAALTAQIASAAESLLLASAVDRAQA